MFLRTHLIVALFLILILGVQDFLFIGIFLLATIIPDIDTRFSKIGKHFKILNFFMKHRGIVHSFTFLFLISIFFLIFFREILIPFSFGFSVHLFLDGITINGVRLFYPMKFRMKGIIRTGKIAENLIFVFFLTGDLFLLYKLF